MAFISSATGTIFQFGNYIELGKSSATLSLRRKWNRKIADWIEKTLNH
jgi:hypothetical protein